LTKPVNARNVKTAEEAELRQVVDDPERMMRRPAGPWSILVCITAVQHGLATGRKSKHRSVVGPEPVRCTGR
jgi:hypothetical protein